MAYTLPKLPYDYEALEPHIDAQTMYIHHTKHHQTYINNLNTALANATYDQDKPIEDLLRHLHQLPESVQTAVRNNGGGHANHSLFWTIMTPKVGGVPTSEVLKAIERDIAPGDAWKTAFTKAAVGRFGSGWAWLSVNSEKKLVVHSTANQDSPLCEGLTPILGLDVWEHAYYLRYQNRRPDYITAFFNLIDWDAVHRRYADAIG